MVAQRMLKGFLCYGVVLVLVYSFVFPLFYRVLLIYFFKGKVKDMGVLFLKTGVHNSIWRADSAGMVFDSKKDVVAAPTKTLKTKGTLLTTTLKKLTIEYIKTMTNTKFNLQKTTSISITRPRETTRRDRSPTQMTRQKFTNLITIISTKQPSLTLKSKSSRPVETLNRPVETSSRHVETSSRPVETSSRHVETSSRHVEMSSRPVKTSSRPVETSSRSVETSSPPAQTSSRPLPTSSRSVETSSRPLSITTSVGNVSLTEHSMKLSADKCIDKKTWHILSHMNRTSLNMGEYESYMNTHCVVGRVYPKCVARNLVGPLQVYKEPLPPDALREELNFVKQGGWWSPADCIEIHRTAIIIPFRDRYQHLPVFLRQLHGILKRQFLHYRVFVVEQDDRSRFNRGKLMNVGYQEALKIFPYTCFVFHDVDLIPEDDRISYGCKHSPMHLSAAVSKWFYQLPYWTIFGGVEMFTTEDYKTANGFPNLFYNWGGEDDVLYTRIRNKGMELHRQSLSIARYYMLDHKPIEVTRTAADTALTSLMMKTAREHQHDDGVNSLQYKVNNIQEHGLYTMIKVDLQKEKEKTFGMKI